MGLVPSLVLFVSTTPELKSEDLGSLRSIQSGAAHTGTAVVDQLFAKVGREIFFQEVYGMTELSPFCTVMNPSKWNTKLGSVGTLVPGTIAKVIDADSGKSLAAGEEGELCVKGPQVKLEKFKTKI